MSRRLIEASLLAYPRDVRRRDRAHLRDLALELGEERGFLREALGLFRGGLVERWRSASPRRRVVAASTAGLALVLLAAPAVAAPIRVEEEIVTCTADPCS